MYIGQTIRPVEQRFNRHINDAINNILDTHFARAIRKYGKENFVIEVIDTATSQEELNFKEWYWIQFYDSVHSGYNETDALNKCGGNTYQSKTSEELEAIADKISKSKMGSKNPNSKKVKCLNTFTKEELFFDTVQECQQYFHEAHHRFITERVMHRVKSLYKGVWNISYSDEEYSIMNPTIIKSGISIMVDNTLTGEHYDFKSIRGAARTLDIDRNAIKKHRDNCEKNFTIGNYIITILD